MAGGDEGFLRRWSRLKREGGKSAPEKAEARPGTPPAMGGEGGAAQAGDPGTLAPKDLNLPDIDSLDKDSDFTAFLRKGVPERLQRLALRKLWQSDPVFSIIDGLDDYDDDFQTIMEEGTAAMQKARKAAKKLAAADDDQAEAPASEEPAPAASADAEDEIEEIADAEGDTEEVAEDEPAEAASEGSEKPSTG